MPRSCTTVVINMSADISWRGGEAAFSSDVTFTHGDDSHVTQGLVAPPSNNGSPGYFAFRTTLQATAKVRPRLLLDGGLTVGHEYTVSMWIHFPLPESKMLKQMNKGHYRETPFAAKKHCWHVAIFSDDEGLVEQYPLCFLSYEGEPTVIGVHSNDWEDRQFFIPFAPEAAEPNVGIWKGWKLLTLVAKGGGGRSSSTLFVDGEKFGVATAAAMCPFRAFGGHPYTRKGECTQDILAFSSLHIWPRKALTSAAIATHVHEELANPPRALHADAEVKHVAQPSDGAQLVESATAAALAPVPAPASAGGHPGVTCDRSGVCPIVGNRYHLRGEDYDLCQAEYDKLDDKEKADYECIPPKPAVRKAQHKSPAPEPVPAPAPAPAPGAASSSSAPNALPRGFRRKRADSMSAEPEGAPEEEEEEAPAVEASPRGRGKRSSTHVGKRPVEHPTAPEAAFDDDDDDEEVVEVDDEGSIDPPRPAVRRAAAASKAAASSEAARRAAIVARQAPRVIGAPSTHGGTSDANAALGHAYSTTCRSNADGAAVPAATASNGAAGAASAADGAAAEADVAAAEEAAVVSAEEEVDEEAEEEAEEAEEQAMLEFVAKKTEIEETEKELSRKRKAYDSREREMAISKAREEARKADAKLAAAKKAAADAKSALDQLIADDGGVHELEQKVKRLKDEKAAAKGRVAAAFRKKKA